MVFDEAKFRAEAKAAGYSDADIDAELKTPAAPAASAPPPSPATASGNEIAAKNDAEFAKRAKEEEEKFNQPLKNPSSFPIQVGDFKADATVPGLLAAGAATGTMLYGGYKAGEKVATAAGSAANKVYDSLRAKMSSGAQPTPTFAQELAGEQNLVPETQPKATTQSVGYREYSPETLKELERLQNEYAQLQSQDVTPRPTSPTVPLETEVGKAPKDMSLVEESQQNKLKNELAKEKQITPDATVKSFERDAKGNIKYPEGMTPAAKAGAEAFAAQYPDQAKAFAAKGQFGILGAGSSMNSLYNTWGKDVAKQLRNELVSGNLLGGAQEYPSMLSKIAAIPPESATGKQLADIREKNPKGGTYGVLGKSVTMQEGKLIEGKNKVPGIVAKGVGPAVLLMAISDAAKAKSAREGAGVLAEGIFNAVAPAGIGASELAPATLYTPAQQQEFTRQLAAQKEAERQKLGSPYRSVPPPR
jgi:hypothetical protein